MVQTGSYSGVRGRAFAACLALASAVALSACSTSDYSAPSSFTVSGSAVSDVVTQAINNTSGSPGLNGSPQVNCDGETSCNITYTVKEPTGIDSNLELVQPTRQIWKAMFEDSNFQSGRIEVDGPLTSVGGKSSTGPFFTLSCDRSAASQIDWNNVDGKGLKALCTYTQMAKL